MKLKTRLVIAFFTIIIIPVLMAAMMVSMVCRYQIGVVEKNYGITGTTISDFTNSMQVLARVTEKPYHELKDMSEQASEMEDATELDQFNKKLENKNAYLLVRKDGTIVYTGSDDDRVKAVIEQLPGYGDTDTTSENGIYLGGDAEALVKQVDFRYDDGNKGSAFIVSDVSNVIPEVGQFFCEILIGIVVILILTSAVLIIWIYRAVMGPIGKMQTAAQNIKDGNLDFELKPEADDELGKLCQSLSRRILNNEEDAKECVNDTWLGVWNSIPPQTPNPLVSYVCRITRNLSVKRLRHNMAAKRNSYYDVSLAELEECIPAAQEQEPWEEQEVTKVLERFLRELDTGSRVMFVKRYWYAESVAQIAETFGMKENSVSVKLMRLRKKLRKKLEKEGVVL